MALFISSRPQFCALALALAAPLAAKAAPGATDPQWRALLHFAGSEGGVSSAKPGAPFFLSPQGSRDPARELATTLEYFKSHPDEAGCRFPARAMYLGFAPEGGKGDVCDRWRSWRAAIRAKSAELVFASAFISSPSSMYGHTLLKFVRSGETEGEDLLDYTLNYGADTGASGGLAYLWLGLTGGFEGSYTTAPFYLKVREYNFVENRDFWLYPLRLTSRELDLLVAHAWELRGVGFPYFFLHRNCAFYILELLEVARPGSDFTAHFPFWTVPADTIRLLQKEGVAGEPRYRASRYRRLRAFREALAPGEIDIVEQLAESGEAGALPVGREARLLGAAYELWRYRNEKKGNQSSSLVEARLLTALATHSQFASPPVTPEIHETRPELGHPTTRVYGAYGRERQGGFTELGYRGKLTDLLADPGGYEEYGELSMGDLRARIEGGQLFLERADVLRLRSLAPRETWIPRWSWGFRTGFERAKEFACTAWGCSAGEMEGSVGVSARLGPLLAFATVGTGLEAGRPFDRSYRWGAGPEGGVFAPLWPGARALLEGVWRLRLLGSQTPRRGAGFGIAQSISQGLEARLAGEVTYGYREGMAQLDFYF